MRQTVRYFATIILLMLLIPFASAQEATGTESSPASSPTLSRYAQLEISTSFSYAFTPDSQFLIINTENDIQFYKLAELGENQTAFATIVGYDYKISADEKWFFVTTDSEFQAYELASLSAEPSPLVSFPYTGSSKYYNFTEDEHWLTITSDSNLKLYDMSNLSADTVPALETSSSRYNFNKDHTALAVFNSSDDKLRFYDLTASPVADSEVIVATLTSDYPAIGFNATGTTLLFSSETGAEFWDIATGEQKSYAWDALVDYGFYFVFSPDDRYLALDASTCSPGYCRGEMRVLDLSSMEIVYSFPYDGAYINTISFSSDGALVAFGSSTTGSWSSGFQTGTSFIDGKVHLIQLESGEDILNRSETDGILGAIIFTPDNSRLIYTSIPFLSQFPDWSGAVIHVVDVSSAEDVFSFTDAGLASSLNADNPNLLETTSMIVLPGVYMFGGDYDLSLDLTTGENPYSGVYLGDTITNEAETLLIATSYNYDSTEGSLRFYKPASTEILMEVRMNGVNGFSTPNLSPDEAYLAVQYTVGTYPDENYHLLLFGLH